MEKVLTVVIPSFNVEKYLRQTLESLRNEEILEDVEVLIVDDGSTDGTAKIGKEYEKRYPQTYRVISKTNGGHGSTINCGIEQSRGTFFKVVDGDDWVSFSRSVNVERALSISLARDSLTRERSAIGESSFTICLKQTGNTKVM